MLACFVIAALPTVPQVAAQPCNNQTRHITTMAGNHSTGTSNCATFSFTITIAGQSFTFNSPSSCDTGRREQDKDCYDCGPASQGNHCKAKGFLANVKIYSIGGANPCPTFPDPLPTTLASASAAIQCASLPQISNENNWCASVSHCEGVPPALVLGDGQGARSHWVGRSFDLDWNRSLPRSEFDAWLRSLPRLPPEALPATLQGALSQAEEVEAAEVVGILDILYFAGGVPWISNRFDFTALVTHAGLHVREREFVPDEEGQVTVRVESLIHDGRTLLVESDQGTVGQAYLPGYSDLAAVLRARLAPYSLLETWLQNPLGVQGLVGMKYESLSDSRGDPIVIETYPGLQGPGTDGSTVLRFGGHEAFPRLESAEYRASDGTVRLRRELSAWSEIAEGVYRPGRIVETRRDPKGGLETMKTLQLRALRSMSLTQARARGWLAPRAEEWLVYQ